jgi:WD40 repeat protein
VDSIAVSAREDKMVFSGRYKQIEHCGVFQVLLSEGSAREIIANPKCGYASGWLSLSLSPTGEQGVAIHDHRLVLINIVQRTVKSIGEGYSAVSWSPDGHWIAALENRNLKTVLLDTGEFSVRRTLDNSEVRWSPDSRYLLRVRPCRFSDSGTVEALDVASGKKITIKSSTCGVHQTTTGWVSKNILP